MLTCQWKALALQQSRSGTRWRPVKLERRPSPAEAAVDGIISIDEHGVIQTINPAGQRLFGYSAEEIIGQNIKVLMPSPYRAEHDGYLIRYLATGKKKVIGIGREVVGLRRNSTSFPMGSLRGRSEAREMSETSLWASFETSPRGNGPRRRCSG